MSWNAFRGAVLLQMARIAMQPYGAAAKPEAAGPAPLPDSPVYQSQTFFRPYARLGNHFFGGDWYAGHRLADGSLWVFLADVTGHGYYAYLLASALPGVWQRCWQAHPGQPPEPAELLGAMHELLADCLPEGIFLECTLARLADNGQITVVPAGGTRLWLRCGTRKPVMLKLRGAWLGLRAPTADEQHILSLGHGDELLLATDGVFDQLEDHGGTEAVTQAQPPPGRLFEVVRELLERSLANEPQKDDITMVLLRRRQPSEDSPPAIRLFAVRNRTGDVSV
jgi:serine phosphatase RsbU (regulator of sigma subunit)